MKLTDLIGTSLLYTSKELKWYMEKHSVSELLGSGQMPLLVTIREERGISQKDLAEKLKKDKTTIAKAIKRMEKAEYIERRKDEIDKRVYKLYLTPKGEEAYPKVVEYLGEIEAKLNKAFTQEEKEQFLSFLERIRNTIAED